MMKNTTLFLLAATAFLLIGCVPVTVKYDYHTQTDFSSFHTFNFMPIPETARWNEILIGRIQKTVIRRMEMKGLKQETANPDLLIAVYTRRREKVDVQSYGYAYFPVRFYWRPFSYWGGPWGIDIQQYDEGKIILDFVDARNKKLVWRAVAIEDLPDPENPGTMQTYVERAVSKMLKKFPPNG
jgi:hypothetical protein